MEEGFIFFDVRIRGPDRKYVYAVFEGYEDEKIYPLIIDDPEITSDGRFIVLEWHTLQEHMAKIDDFTIEAVNEAGNYEEIECTRYRFVELPNEAVIGCEIDKLVFLSGDIDLDYGMKVNIRIKGSDGNYYGARVNEESRANVLTPYISGEFVFGYQFNKQYPLDYEQHSYPTKTEIAKLDLSEEHKL